MATPVITPTPSGPVAAPVAPTGATAASVLDAAFANAANPPAAPAVDPASPAVPATPPALASPEPPAAPVTDQPPDVPPIEQPAARATEEPLDFTDGTAPDSIDADGKRHFFKADKSYRLQQAGKFIQGLQEVLPPAEITLDRVKERIAMANAADGMISKYEAAAVDPANIKDVIDLFASDKNEQVTPQIKNSFASLAFEALSRLPQINPEAFKHVLSVHNTHTLTALRQTAQQTQNTVENPQAREQAAALATRFEMWITGGKYTPQAQWMNGTQVDPVEQQRQQLDRDRQAFQREQQQVQQTQQQQWSSRVGSAQDQAQMEEVDAGLASVINKPEYAPYREEMRQKLFQTVRRTEAEHPEWENGWKTRNEQAILYPNEPNLKAVADYRRNIARPIVRREAAAVIGFYSNAVLTNNQQLHARAGQAVASEPAPNGVASTPANGIKIDDAVKAKGWDGVMKAIGW